MINIEQARLHADIKETLTAAIEAFLDNTIKTNQRIDFWMSICAGLLMCGTVLVVAIGMTDLLYHTKAFSDVPSVFKSLFDIPVGYVVIVALAWLIVIVALKFVSPFVNKRINQWVIKLNRDGRLS